MHVWVFQTGEILPCDKLKARKMRASNISHAFAQLSCTVRIISSSFCHISNNGTILVQRQDYHPSPNNSWVVKHLPPTYVAPTWIQKGQTINGTSSGDQFATTVAISGDGSVIAGGAI